MDQDSPSNSIEMSAVGKTSSQLMRGVKKAFEAAWFDEGMIITHHQSPVFSAVKCQSHSFFAF
jgi:hypothetical protein